ncbi:MAG TPA: hypothetical protein VGK59_18395 [Ohtaekwangia sp.]
MSTGTEKKESKNLRSLSHKELAVAYGVSRKVFSKWIRSINTDLGPRTGHYYNILQVNIIFERFGRPGNIG